MSLIGKKVLDIGSDISSGVLRFHTGSVYFVDGLLKGKRYTFSTTSVVIECLPSSAILKNVDNLLICYNGNVFFDFRDHL